MKAVNFKRGALVPIELNFNRILLLLAAVLFAAGRVTGDTLLYHFAGHTTTPLIIWKLLTALLITAPLFLYVFSAKQNGRFTSEEDTSEQYLSELSTLQLTGIAIIVAKIIAPMKLNDAGIPVNFLSVIFADVFSIASITLSILAANFLYKWLLFRRHKRTKLSLGLMGFFILFFVLSDWFMQTFRLGGFFDIIYEVIVILLLFFVFFTTRKNSWIALLPRKQKMKLLWLSLSGILVFTILMFNFLRESATLNDSRRYFLSGIDFFPGLVFVYLTAYITRIFFAAVAAMPTSGIVERRTSEISSLAYLNRIVAQTIDINTLIDTVTRLAHSASQATAAWTEVYENGDIKIESVRDMDPAKISELHKNDYLKNEFIKLRSPELIESLPSSERFRYVNSVIPIASSMIAVPLFAGEERIGTLVVVNDEEYGFDRDDLKVLTAFSDNVVIALENTRLIKDSLDKEHLKRELEIARDIQKKLLPGNLMEIPGYTISAFSRPAAEVGGDFYDMGYLKDGRFCILIGDVSGKGMNAAFYMAQLKGVVLSVAKQSDGAADVLKRINSVLHKKMDRQIFITMLSIVIDKNDPRVTIARAGHMPALIKNGGKTEVIKPKGIGIGLAASSVFDANLEEKEIEMRKGSSCLLFTDGINEMNSEENKPLGIDGLISMINDTDFDDAKHFAEYLRNRISSYSDSEEQHDDMTAVAIMYHG